MTNTSVHGKYVPVKVWNLTEGNMNLWSKGPSQKYLEANEVKYFSLGGGVGDFMVTISLFQKKIGFVLVFTIIEWSQK